MSDNSNVSYGRANLDAATIIANMPPTGKLFVVGDSSTPNKVLVDNIYKTDDNGIVRFWPTLDEAIGKCTADAGDVILVLPSHAEAVTATSIAVDVAGISIVHTGNAENQAVYTFGAAASTITVSAANVRIVGGKYLGNFLNVASAFTVTTANNFELSGAQFEDTSATLNFLSIVTTTTTDNAADGLVVNDNKYLALDVTPLAFISVLGDLSRLTVKRNFVDYAATSGGEFLTFAAKSAVGVDIDGNAQIIVGGTGVTTGIFLTGSGTAFSGIVRNNMIASLDTTSELIATAGTGLQYFNNYYTGNADSSGKLWPVVDVA